MVPPLVRLHWLAGSEAVPISADRCRGSSRPPYIRIYSRDTAPPIDLRQIEQIVQVGQPVRCEG